MRERLGRALTLLQGTPLPVDLADNPAKTGQWLIALGNLQQILQLLQGQSSGGEGRAGRAVRVFNRMIEGLPVACLSGLPATAKLGLLRPLLTEIEADRATTIDRWQTVRIMMNNCLAADLKLRGWVAQHLQYQGSLLGDLSSGAGGRALAAEFEGVRKTYGWAVDRRRKELAGEDEGQAVS